uniref:hypothetical protein n=1 Tax=Candidatus Cryptobacteroides bacterium TaxID=3085639 RepID=UPI0040256E2F
MPLPAHENAHLSPFVSNMPLSAHENTHLSPFVSNLPLSAHEAHTVLLHGHQDESHLAVCGKKSILLWQKVRAKTHES